MRALSKMQYRRSLWLAPGNPEEDTAETANVGCSWLNDGDVLMLAKVAKLKA